MISNVLLEILLLSLQNITTVIGFVEYWSRSWLATRYWPIQQVKTYIFLLLVDSIDCLCIVTFVGKIYILHLYVISVLINLASSELPICYFPYCFVLDFRIFLVGHTLLVNFNWLVWSFDFYLNSFFYSGVKVMGVSWTEWKEVIGKFCKFTSNLIKIAAVSVKGHPLSLLSIFR